MKVLNPLRIWSEFCEGIVKPGLVFRFEKRVKFAPVLGERLALIELWADEPVIIWKTRKLNEWHGLGGVDGFEWVERSRLPLVEVTLRRNTDLAQSGRNSPYTRQTDRISRDMGFWKARRNYHLVLQLNLMFDF